MALFDIGIAPTIISRLLTHIKSRHIYTSYLLLGKQDRFGFQLAIGFAKALNCESMSGNFCGTCHTCKMIGAATHPDVKIYDPGSSKFGIGLVRQIQLDSSETNYSAKYRVNILKSSETMTIEAQNALLKVFEDGKPNCINILLSTSLVNMLQTIISRSLILRLPTPDIKITSEFLVRLGFPEHIAYAEASNINSDLALLSWIAENKEKAESAISVLSNLGEGSLVPAISLFENEADIEFILLLYQQILSFALLKKNCMEFESYILKEGVNTLSKFDKVKLEKIREAVKDIERLWKTQTKKTYLVQTRFLKSWI